MNTYEDVKVGDQLFYSRSVGLSHWGQLYFSRLFYIECKVIKVTKTQFTTESGRYRKSDGYGIADSQSIYKLGDSRSWNPRKGEKITKCETMELANYNNEIQILRDAQFVDLGSIRVTKIKNLETAQKAASLINQLESLMELEQ